MNLLAIHIREVKKSMDGTLEDLDDLGKSISVEMYSGEWMPDPSR